MQNTKLAFCLFIIVVFSSCKKDKGDETVSEIETFSKTFGGTGNESGNSVAASSTGEIFCFGTTSAGPNGGKDFYLVKTDKNGNKVFEKNFGGAGDETGYCVIRSSYSDPGIIMAGSTTSYGAGGSDMFIIKTDDSGNIIFSKFFGTAADEVATLIIKVSGLGFLLGGYSVNAATGKDFFLVCIADDGTVLWTKTYGGPSDEYIHDIRPFLDLNQQLQFLVLGNTYSYGAGDEDFYLMKLTENGDSLWARTYGGSGYEQAGSIMLFNDRFYLCGHSSSNGHPEHNVYLVRTDTTGAVIWEKNYGGMMHDGVETGLISGDHNHIVMAGYSSSYGAGDVDFLFMKTDLDGNAEDIQSIGTTSENASFGMIETSSSYFLAGYQKDPANTNSDMLLVKLKK